jgi:hypothetical protein
VSLARFEPVMFQAQVMDMRYGQLRIFLYTDSSDILTAFFNYIGYTELNGIMTITDEWVRMWRGAVVIYFKVLFHTR